MSTGAGASTKGRVTDGEAGAGRDCGDGETFSQGPTRHRGDGAHAWQPAPTTQTWAGVRTYTRMSLTVTLLFKVRSGNTDLQSML